MRSTGACQVGDTTGSYGNKEGVDLLHLLALRLNEVMVFAVPEPGNQSYDEPDMSI